MSDWNVSVQFVEKANGPERLVCEAEISFGPACGPLDGMKLVGFSIWRSAEGDHFVSLPARPFGSGGSRRYFDLLRSVAGQAADAKRLKLWIMSQYHEQAGEAVSA